LLVCLEMDEGRMTSIWFDSLPGWATFLSLAVHLSAGIAVGHVYFWSLWWNVRRFTDRGGAARTIALQTGRFAVLGSLLTLASQEGALPLLAMALGVLIARAAVMRTVREAAP
jgi:F1F0 ATPase subunit 2